MVYDGGVKDQAGEPTANNHNQANPSASSSSSKSDLDKKLGVRHPLKHKRFRAGGKKMADPTSSVVEEEEVGSTSEGATVLPELVVPSGADVAEQERSDPEEDDVGYKSGGWKSEDGRLSCGYASFRGKRASMEDFYDAKSSQIEGKVISLFGIFDGHGGSRAAEYLKEHLFNNLMKHPQFMEDTKLAISSSYIL